MLQYYYLVPGNLHDQSRDENASQICRQNCKTTHLLLETNSEARLCMMRYSLTLDSIKPFHSRLCKLFELRCQLRGMQTEIIHGTNSQNAHTRKSAAAPVHQIATGGAETVFHCST